MIKKEHLQKILLSLLEKQSSRKIKKDSKFDSIELIGPESSLDSYSLVSYIISIEEELKKCDLDINIMSDKTFSKSESPFKSLKTLEIYILELINEKK